MKLAKILLPLILLELSPSMSAKDFAVDDLESNKVYSYVEQMPTFPGGEGKLMQYIADSLRYPSSAQEQNIQGVVMLRFVVLGSGKVGDVQVLKSIDPACDREAVRVVKSMPRFIPGRLRGKPVSVWFQLPIRFQRM